MPERDVAEKIDVIQYLFRAPEFPLICDAGSVLIGAVSPQDFEAQMARLDLPPDGTLTVIDVAIKNWVFYTQNSTLSPLRRKNGWTKKKVTAPSVHQMVITQSAIDPR